jgi:hypothetical protein
VCTSGFCTTLAGICGGATGQRCTGGTNSGSPCSASGTQCPGSGASCQVPGAATLFNQCSDAFCSATNTCVGGTNQDANCVDNSECPGGTCAAGNEGTCAAGPFDQYCGPVGTFKGCTSDADCTGLNACVGGGTPGLACSIDGDCSGGLCKSKLGGVAELCINGHNRDCFLDNGVLGGTVVATGLADPPTNDQSDPTLAALFCIGPTSSGAVNGAAGLPGLGRLELPGHAQGLP